MLFENKKRENEEAYHPRKLNHRLDELSTSDDQFIHVGYV